MGHILVVEDDESIVDLLTSALAGWGHGVTVARDGHAGYHMIARRLEDFDVILCDLHLPRMSGKQMLDRVAGLIRGRTPVIVMSGLPHLRDALRETRMSAFCVLAKPFDSIDYVRDTIQNALEQRRLQRSVAEKNAQIAEFRMRVEFLSTQATELLTESRRDPLTSLPTRNQLADDICALEAAPASLNTDAVFCLIDMDNFRRFNRDGSYSEGDTAIQWVADELGRGSRDRDEVYRWGGDEFVVLITSVDLKKGVEIADRLCRYVAAASQESGSMTSVTMSAGVVRIPAHSRDPLRMLIDEAQGYLAQAKAGGGNRVASALRTPSVRAV
jgi:diguanylate cyclase (GGDEF)-like protein